jgi:hypothetical protein
MLTQVFHRLPLLPNATEIIGQPHLQVFETLIPPRCGSGALALQPDA